MKLPVLILPGFASSGMEVVTSDIDESHEGDRVWMNPVALGFGALHFGGAYKKEETPTNDAAKSSESIPESKEDLTDRTANSEYDSDDDAQEELRNKLGNEKYESALKCRSAWIHHLSLADDKITERGNNKIRPMAGLDGVDFITDIASFKVAASYVFGPIINALVDAGYTKGLNLDAATYDFRLPPAILEQRDQYFTNTLTKIEDMYEKNDRTPVVLLCHSLGCKIGHYLLNFAKVQKGRQWIDRHIHTYMPVGAPHIGAREMVVQEFSPSTDTPVDSLMSTEEKLVLFRSWGSCAWMMPRYLPPRTITSPGLICREEGFLEISVKDSKINMKGSVRAARLYLSYGKRTARSSLTAPSSTNEDESSSTGEDGSPKCFHFVETFMFSTTPSLENGLECLTIELREPSTLSNDFRTTARGVGAVAGGVGSTMKPVIGKVATGIGSGAVSLAYNMKNKMSKIETVQNAKQSNFFKGFKSGAKTLGKYASTAASHLGSGASTAGQYVGKGASVAGSHIGAYAQSAYEKTDTAHVTVAKTDEINNLHELILENAGELNTMSGCYETELPVTLRVNEGNENVSVRLNIKWTPPSTLHTPEPGTTPIAELPEGTDKSLTLPIVSKKHEASEYHRVSGQHLLREGMGKEFFNLVQNQYEGDSTGPRSQSAQDAPPVPRVYAIYGINVPTTDGAVFCRPKSIVLGEKQVKQRYVLDKSAKLALEHIQPHTSAFGNYEVKNGKIKEVPHKTAQTDLITGKTIYRSGDGTVPYWSLQQVQLWNSDECKVKITELEGAIHRDILIDRRFHRLLIEYVGGEDSIREFEAAAAAKIQKAAASRNLLKNQE